jgi:hypothetical protein
VKQNKTKPKTLQNKIIKESIPHPDSHKGGIKIKKAKSPKLNKERTLCRFFRSVQSTLLSISIK